MRLSKSFAHTTKTDIGDGDSANYKLLVKAGMIDQVAAGVYSYLPLGLRVLERIAAIIRKHINEIGEEVLMPVLHPKALWEKTGRWEGTGNGLYRLKDSGGREFALGPTHEEILTPLATKMIQSYRDLPRAVYQIQTKFRDEPRARSGLLRGREFLMKDLYSFHLNAQDFEEYYQKAKQVYLNIFNDLGLKVRIVEASGGTFTKKRSHEFQVFCDTGEDTVYYCDKCDWAENDEIATVKTGDKCPNCSAEVLQTRAIEVGNIFPLEARFSEPFNLKVSDELGQQQTVLMGCYGIGISRAMGAIVETSNDERGIIWPEAVSPADYHLVVLSDDAVVRKTADELYESLVQSGKSVIYDDTDNSAGEKLADADLIGVPTRLVVSPKSQATDAVEVKKRDMEESELVKINEFIK